MDIILADELASYLRDDSLTGADLDLIVELANGVVSDALGPQAADYEPSARVRAITLEIAARAYRNPQGYSSETIDDYTYRRDADTRQAGVYLTASELDELQLSAGALHVKMGWLA